MDSDGNNHYTRKPRKTATGKRKGRKQTIDNQQRNSNSDKNNSSEAKVRRFC